MLNADTLHKRAARVLPEVIQTSGMLLADEGEDAMAALLFPLRRRSSGSLMFRLSASMIASLSNDPIQYLTDATRARESTSRHAKPFTYRPWRKASLPLDWLHAGAPHAGSKHPVKLEAYFTARIDGKALLVLMPAERLLVYVWSD